MLYVDQLCISDGSYEAPEALLYGMVPLTNTEDISWVCLFPHYAGTKSNKPLGAKTGETDNLLPLMIVSCANAFETTFSFIFYQVQYNWIYVEVFDPFGLEFCESTLCIYPPLTGSLSSPRQCLSAFLSNEEMDIFDMLLFDISKIFVNDIDSYDIKAKQNWYGNKRQCADKTKANIYLGAV
ncbi:hypothetical protein STEG23_022560 [Scotinomys teguina]